MEPKIAIVGAGAHASNNIYPFIGKAGGQIVGVCDLDGEKAARNARRFGGQPFSRMETMLDQTRPDAVIICIGPQQHAELAPVVMRRGLPVYTEKPAAPCAAQTLELARLSRETGVLCTTAFKKRYSIAYERAREFIEEFPAEDLLSISMARHSGAYDNSSPRFDFLLDFGIHGIDLLQYLAGNARRVFAFTRDRHAYAVSLEFENGGVGALDFSDGRSFGLPSEEIEITIKGGHWMTIHNSNQWRMAKSGQPCHWREAPLFAAAGDSGNETGHCAELRDFFAAVQQNRTTRSNVYESYKSMVLYEAIEQSARQGRVVEVHYEAL